MKQVKRCDGTVNNIVKVELSGDAYAWDFWYYTDDNECIFGLEIEEDLSELLLLNKFVEKWAKKIRKTNGNQHFKFQIDI